MSAVKTVSDFIELVRSMRVYQKEYLDKRNVLAKSLAQKYEAQVDEAIKERDERAAAEAQRRQPGLPGIKQ